MARRIGVSLRTRFFRFAGRGGAELCLGRIHKGWELALRCFKRQLMEKDLPVTLNLAY